MGDREGRPRFSSLEAALLYSEDHPEVSPVYEFQLRGQQVRVVFRALSQTQLDRLGLSAQTWLENERRAREAKGQDWRDHLSTVDRVHKNRVDLLMLHAAMRDPEDHTREACSLVVLERHLDPDTHAHLAEKFEQWRAGLSLDGVTAQDILDFRADVKKNADPVYLWMRYGFKIPLASAISSVLEAPGTSQTEA